MQYMGYYAYDYSDEDSYDEEEDENDDSEQNSIDITIDCALSHLTFNIYDDSKVESELYVIDRELSVSSKIARWIYCLQKCLNIKFLDFDTFEFEFLSLESQYLLKKLGRTPIFAIKNYKFYDLGKNDPRDNFKYYGRKGLPYQIDSFHIEYGDENIEGLQHYWKYIGRLIHRVQNEFQIDYSKISSKTLNNLFGACTHLKKLIFSSCLFQFDSKLNFGKYKFDLERIQFIVTNQTYEDHPEKFLDDIELIIEALSKGTFTKPLTLSLDCWNDITEDIEKMFVKYGLKAKVVYNQ